MDSEDQSSSIRNLYLGLTEEELEEGEENLERNLEVVLRIYERIRKDPEEHVRFRKLLAEKTRRTE